MWLCKSISASSCIEPFHPFHLTRKHLPCGRVTFTALECYIISAHTGGRIHINSAILQQYSRGCLMDFCIIALCLYKIIDINQPLSLSSKGISLPKNSGYHSRYIPLLIGCLYQNIVMLYHSFFKLASKSYTFIFVTFPILQFIFNLIHHFWIYKRQIVLHHTALASTLFDIKRVYVEIYS